jgi:perosamine synthetase
MNRIPVAGPWITQHEIDYVSDAAANAWYHDAGKYHQRFEAAFADYVGRKYAISLPSCTSALHLSLAGLGVSAGDEVIVPDITWIATAAPVTYLGAQPVFADVAPDSWCLSPESVETCITSRTRAIIAVDLYGCMPDYDALQAVADSYGIPLIEDAAEAIGSEYRGRKAGSLGVASTFSFHGSKTLTTGEGGMLVTDCEALYERSLFLRDHGRPPGDRLFFNTEVAFKYRMSSMQAALGLAQLERIRTLINKKREVYSWYRENLPQIGLLTNPELPDVFNTYWMVTILLPKTLALSKLQVLEALGHQGIDSRPFFHPLSSIPAFSDSNQAMKARQRNRVSYDLSPRGLNLPSSLLLTRSDVEQVCAALSQILMQADSKVSERDRQCP